MHITDIGLNPQIDQTILNVNIHLANYKLNCQEQFTKSFMFRYETKYNAWYLIELQFSDQRVADGAKKQ